MSLKKKKPFLGHSVENGRVRHSSVSQIKLFDPKSEGCNRKWAFSYKYGKKLKRTGAQERGGDRSEKLEHYLTTGEDVLPPDMAPLKKFLPKPGKDLECEELLGDMEKAVALRDTWLKQRLDPVPAALAEEIRKFAGLTAAGIPLDGAADVRHVRGTWIDADGHLRQEYPGTRVVTIFDLKMVSRIFPHKITRGENAGKILQAYTLTDNEICNDTQMIGYARQAIYRRPDTTHVRLQLGYANTSRREAVLRQGLVSVEQILSRWDRVEGIARKMESVATADKIEDIEPNILACDSYTHIDPTDPEGKRVLKGCGHKYYCPLAISQSIPNMLGNYKERTMSLFDEPTAPIAQTPPPPAAPPLDAAAHAAAVAAEKERIRAEDAARTVAPPPPAPTVALGFCSKCGTALNASNASRLQSGELKHIGCAAAAAPPPPAAPSPPIAVNPPDQPRAATMMELAAPVPPHEIAQIDDPEIKATVEEHARQHAEKAAREAAEAETAKIAAGAAVWCAVSATKVIITTEMALARKFTCGCGKSYSIKVLNPLKEGNDLVSVIPRHKLPKKDGEAAAAAPPPAEKKIKIIYDETNSGDEADDEGDDVVEFAPPPPPPPAAAPDPYLAGIMTPPAPPVAAAPPPPPPPTQANVLVESGRTSCADMNLSNPPRGADEAIVAVDVAVGMAKPSMNGNGHANGHALEMPVPPLPVIATTGKVRAFHVEAHINVDGTRTAKKRVVLAGSAREAMTKIEESFGAAFIEVRWIKVIVGAVIS